MVVRDNEVALSLEIDPAGQRAQVRRAALASSIGTTIEWYDFFLYNTAAALVFPVTARTGRDAPFGLQLDKRLVQGQQDVRGRGVAPLAPLGFHFPPLIDQIEAQRPGPALGAGEVLAAGDGRLDDDGKRIPLDVKKGDEVLYSKYGGTEIKVDGEDLLVLRESDVLARVES